MSSSKSTFQLRNARRNPLHGFEVSRPVAISLLVAGCASNAFTPPDLPVALRPPQNQSAFLEARARGVQIYECAAKSDEPSGFAWTFKAPEATLTDRSGRSIGKHYGGPTWQSIDGSAVVGEVAARDPGPDPSAIPWLFLTAKTTSGAGDFGGVKSIQRVHTAGGVAPSQPCSSSNVKQIARVPYTATYYFYRTTILIEYALDRSSI